MIYLTTKFEMQQEFKRLWNHGYKARRLFNFKPLPPKAVAGRKGQASTATIATGAQMAAIQDLALGAKPLAGR
jgi:hypothetical protein